MRQAHRVIKFTLLLLVFLSSATVAGDVSTKVAGWKASNWISFIDKVAITYSAEEAMQGAFNSAGGYFPMADVLWELSNSGSPVKSDIQDYLRQRLQVRSLENYKKWRYERFLDCLTWSPCEEVRELENIYLGKDIKNDTVANNTEAEQPEKNRGSSDEETFKTSNWKISQWIQFIDKAALDSFETAYASVGGRFPLADSLWRLSNSGSPVRQHLRTLLQQRLETKGLVNYSKWVYQPILECLSWSSCKEVTEAEKRKN
jgi:hypothetical protein